MDENAFVAAVTEGRSVAPMYVAHASQRNRESRPVLDETSRVPALSPLQVDELARGGAALDTRDPHDFRSTWASAAGSSRWPARSPRQVHADDPWGFANSPEWATTRPPPWHHVHELPRIRSERPALDLHHPHLAPRARAEATHTGDRAGLPED